MEFTELDLSKPVDEMEADEARETLAEFMDAHRENQTAYDAVQSEKTEYSEQIDEYEEMIADFREDKAEEAAEYVNMPAGLLADRFEYSELEEIIAEGEEFSEQQEESPDDDDDENGSPLTTFSDKPQKGRKEDTSGTERHRDEAKSALGSHGFPTN